MSNRKTLLAITCSAAIGILIGAGGTALAEKDAGDLNAIPFEGLKTFSEVYNRIRQDYVEPVTDNKLLEDAIRGMLTGLDPHSAYLDQEQYNELKVGTTGQFGGLGIEVDQRRIGEDAEPCRHHRRVEPLGRRDHRRTGAPGHHLRADRAVEIGGDGQAEQIGRAHV